MVGGHAVAWLCGVGCWWQGGGALGGGARLQVGVLGGEAGGLRWHGGRVGVVHVVGWCALRLAICARRGGVWPVVWLLLCEGCAARRHRRWRLLTRRSLCLGSIVRARIIRSRRIGILVLLPLRSFCVRSTVIGIGAYAQLRLRQATTVGLGRSGTCSGHPIRRAVGIAGVRVATCVVGGRRIILLGLV